MTDTTTDPVTEARELLPAPPRLLAALCDETEKARRAAQTLGGILDRLGPLIVAATDSQDLVNTDLDGDWGVIEERLAGIAGARVKLEKVAEMARTYAGLRHRCEGPDADCDACVGQEVLDILSDGSES